jgi:hypothetical protein
MLKGNTAMPYCPRCKYEFREGMTTCSDCGADLMEGSPEEPQVTPVSQEPPSEPLSQEPLAVVYEASDEFHSRLMKNTLEQAGIAVIEQKDRTAAYDNIDFSGVGRYSRLLTVESRAEEAKKIVGEFLEALQRGDLSLTDETAQTDEGEPEERRKKF